MIDLFVAWLPFILIVGGFAFVGLSTSRSYKQHVEKVNAINDRLVAINEEMIAELREIKAILRDRK